MPYVLATVFISFLGVFLFLPKAKPWLKNNEVGVNFITTMIATLVGVLLAIAITNFEEDKKERRDVIKLIGAAEAAIDETQDYGQALIEQATKSIGQNKTDYESELDAFYQRNSLPYPEYLDRFVALELVSKQLSQPTLEMLHSYLINLRRAVPRYPRLAILIQQQLTQILSLEKAMLQGQISRIELEKSHASLLETLDQHVAKNVP